jgi:predicted alpha/beta hydrolase family esterase
MIERPILTVSGLWNSGPDHWQTHWEHANPTWRRVQQRDWDRPDRREWVRALDEAVRSCNAPPVLAAHSLGCSVVAEWAATIGGRSVAGAFLVAPSDVESPTYPIEGRSFSSMALSRFPFPSVVIASTNDEYVSLDRARLFANAWGSALDVIGPAGHINADAGYGPWPEGRRKLAELVARL